MVCRAEAYDLWADSWISATVRASRLAGPRCPNCGSRFRRRVACCGRLHPCSCYCCWRLVHVRAVSVRPSREIARHCVAVRSARRRWSRRRSHGNAIRVLRSPRALVLHERHTRRYSLRHSALLTFDPAGDLVGFVSEDRWQAAPPSPLNVPWSTPISRYCEVNGLRVGTHGNANWIATTGEWTYGRFDIRSMAYNVEK